MNANEVTNAVATAIETDSPLWIWGPPGVGKSATAWLAAQRLGRPMIELRLQFFDPVDLRGLPKLIEEGDDGGKLDGKVVWYRPAFLPNGGNENAVLFLDDLAQAAPLVQNCAMQLVWDRRIAEHVLPEDVRIIAAGNRREDRAHAHAMSTALASRFWHVDFEADVEVWQAWAAAHDVHPHVRAFIRRRPELLHKFDAGQGARTFPCPRTWEVAGRLYSAAPDNLRTQFVAGAVGEAAAAELQAYVEVFSHLPEPDAVYADPKGVEVPDASNVGAVYALCAMLSADAKNRQVSELERLFDFAVRLHGEYEWMLVRDLIAAKRELLKSKKAAAWVAENREALLDLGGIGASEPHRVKLAGD